ncbi:hypothetical protein BKA58DRAFT_322449 [Alternaria rosae]|uniref:uncharacterized protein n=1 Tax=Alternaria rosae TaxID=1187941 RepID=UPI001E8E8831|nr:uncharacterized protein BKA58DRAFT_322449 [Alternaria rosae]KAH6865211.1 hypothetical protein BKA58DRAFT_322449 [Alternaria rosae]
MSTSNWIWSQQYGDYYCVTYDEFQQPVYHWAKQQAQAETPEVPPRRDSGNQYDGSNDVRAMRGFIQGTPHTGWYDNLDSSYCMKTGSEAYQFFVVGRVFAMLYTEAAGETSQANPYDDAYTLVRFGERVYTNIRRFVVLKVRSGFVKACGIGTYSNRGARKGGCRPSEHAIVYLQGTDPASCYLEGERESGMTKEAIEIIPVDRSIKLRSNSRIRFGKTYPIEQNVKVKDIGHIHPSHVGKLLQYWKDED